MGAPAFLSPAERTALDAFVDGARRILGAELIEARLFGSRARREGDDESDLDVVLVVTDAGRRMRRKIYDLAFDVSLSHGVEIAPLVLEEARLRTLRERERMLARELERDGISL
jgi:predicted nucleotidyltransferase